MGFVLSNHPAETTTPAPVLDWEETGCLLCGSSQWSILIEAPDRTPGSGGLWFAVVQCRDCGLCYTNPRPTPDTIGQFYPSDYAPHRKRQKPERFRCGLTWNQPRKERDLLPWHGEGRLLDFGCGSGTYLARLARHGWRVTGLDTSPAAVDRVRGELGLPAFLGTLPHPDLAPQSFDVVTMWHSLEHVHQPLDVLREAHRLLVPGGKLVVGVPNIDSLPFRWFGSAWYGLDLPRHLTHFAPQTLRRMAETAGFHVESLRQVRHSDWLRHSALLACRAKRPAFWQTWLQLKPLCRVATWYAYATGKSDCLLLVATT